MQNFLPVLFCYLIGFRLMAQLALEGMDRAYGRAISADPNTPTRLGLTPEIYQKSVAYTAAKRRIRCIDFAWDAAVLVLILLTSIIPKAFGFILELIGSQTLVAQTVALLVLVWAFGLLDMPLSLYRQFKIEEDFGFNKQKWPDWCLDQIKSWVIGAVIGFPIVWGLLKFYSIGLTYWWVWAWAAIVFFQTALMIAFPYIILPIFNKAKPIDSGALKDRLLQLARDCGYGHARIDVMDGSRRSGHSNAFFTGFGPFRRIFLFDTLIEQMSPEAIAAILAHEIGHYKKGHVLKITLLSIVMIGVGLALLNWALNREIVMSAFGLTELGDAAVGPAAFVFSLIASVLLFWISPLMSLLSRRHEYEADQFAAKAVSAEALVSALDRLYSENLTHFTPHPTYSAFYDSHPAPADRKKALQLMQNA
jgi:STE24 endopeptidase